MKNKIKEAKIELNNTPVRTSRNFNINNIEINELEIPKEIGKFENVSINVNSSKDKVECITNTDNLINNFAYDNREIPYLVYGLGDLLTNQVIQKANQKLKVDIGSKMDNNIIIDYNFDKENVNLVDNIQINANESTKSTIIIKYNSKFEKKTNMKSNNKLEKNSEEKTNLYHNGIVKLLAKKNSEVNIILVNLLDSNANNFISIENEIFDNAKVKYTIIDLGGKISISNYYSNIQGENSKNVLSSIYLGNKEQFFDINYIGELKGEKSEINIDVQGALKDFSKKHFKGTIDFKRGCKKAKGDENESCMLLSDTAKSIALPMLLCSEEDVEGNHSTSSGKVQDKELFYIMSRGFELKEAMKLLVRAKFNRILKNIKDENLKEEILQKIDDKLE